MSWKCNNWNRALASKHYIKNEMVAEMNRNDLHMRAFIERVDSSVTYTICIWDTKTGFQDFREFGNKDEANALWVLWRKKYFYDSVFVRY